MVRILTLIVMLMWVASIGTFISAVAGQSPTITQQVAQILISGFSAIIFAICTVSLLVIGTIAKAGE